MKTIADIKRKMTVGSVWSAIWENASGATKNFGNRTVTANQSNSFAFRNPETGNSSWCDWPKKDEVTFVNENSFVIKRKDMNITLTYTFISEQ